MRLADDFKVTLREDSGTFTEFVEQLPHFIRLPRVANRTTR